LERIWNKAAVVGGRGAVTGPTLNSAINELPDLGNHSVREDSEEDLEVTLEIRSVDQEIPFIETEA
jgi:hypothetical protein